MPQKLTWSSTAQTSLIVGWASYIFTFYPFAIPAIGFWLMFLMAIGGLFSAYYLSAENNRTFKIQLACSIGVLLMYLLIWGNRLINNSSNEYGGVTDLVKMEATLVNHLLKNGEIMRGIQQILFDVIPLWTICWVFIFVCTRPNKESMRSDSIEL